jgi:hypothetical protein
MLRVVAKCKWDSCNCQLAAASGRTNAATDCTNQSTSLRLQGCAQAVSCPGAYLTIRGREARGIVRLSRRSYKRVAKTSMRKGRRRSSGQAARASRSYSARCRKGIARGTHTLRASSSPVAVGASAPSPSTMLSTSQRARRMTSRTRRNRSRSAMLPALRRV